MSNAFRYFNNSISRTGTVGSLNFRLNVKKISAFGGNNVSGVVPRLGVSCLVLRASYPCLTPMPRHNGHGRPTCARLVTRHITSLHRVDLTSISTIAATGTGELFKVWRRGVRFESLYLGISNFEFRRRSVHYTG